VSFSCPVCGQTFAVKKQPQRMACHRCHSQFSPGDPAGLIVKGRNPPLPPIAAGPGTELTAIFTELGITPKASCKCKAKAAQMDAWGIAGCREHRAEIMEWMREAYDTATWSEKATAAWNAMRKGLPLTLEGLLDLAIERAEAKARIIKIAFLSPSMNLGGAERWIISLCRNFDPQKVVAHYVLVKDSKYSSDLMKSWLPKHVRLIDAERLPEVMEQVDFLISWGCLDLPQRVKNFADRVIDIQHGTLGFSNQKEFAAAGVKSGAHLACVHETCLLNFDDADRERVTVIQNGADEDRLIPNRPPTKDRPKTVLFVGRFDPVKNLDGLARAILYLPHDWHLVAAGPPYKMPQEFPALEREGRLTILGPQDNLGNLMQDADVFCAPSHHEANSLAVIEAWLYGIPVVTTSYPTALKVRDDFGPMSWLVPVNPKPQELAAAILEADAAGKWSEQVLHAQETARREFTAKAMAERWEKFISGLPNRDW
jgi:glycosyltransferase involved in cell wall biosynthesis